MASSIAQLSFTQTYQFNGTTITVTTDAPCFAKLYYSTEAVGTRQKWLMVRGLWMKCDVAYSFRNWRIINQSQPGDTLLHTFVIPALTPITHFWWRLKATVFGQGARIASPVTHHVPFVPIMLLPNPSWETGDAGGWTFLQVSPNTWVRVLTLQPLVGKYHLAMRYLVSDVTSPLAYWRTGAVSPYKGRSLYWTTWLKFVAADPPAGPIGGWVSIWDGPTATTIPFLSFHPPLGGDYIRINVTHKVSPNAWLLNFQLQLNAPGTSVSVEAYFDYSLTYINPLP